MRLPAIPPTSAADRDASRAHLDALAVPPGSLGRLADLAAWWCETTGWPPVVPERARLVIFAGDHGAAVEDGTPADALPTVERARNVLAGGAAVNVFARQHGVEVCVVDVGLATVPGVGGTVHATWKDRNLRRGTGNMVVEPAMSREEAEAAVQVGVESAEAAEGIHVLAAGELGLGNTTAAAAVVSALAGLPPELTAGSAAGVRAIRAALARHGPDRADAIGVLAAVGGLEIAAVAGLCIGGAARRVPVLLDGFVSTAGGFAASLLAPDCLPYLYVAHRSAERAHWGLATAMGRPPLHDLDLCVGEGTGAVLAVDSLRLAVRLMGMAGRSGRGGPG
jgi:nicotinate-nucleotide--dimethylbenzimidazole phosphoribosyltransferase